ncbi:TPA: hypothetical protein DEO28_00690 [Candidatus Dependentiae bacterium]|nr:MAG: Beta-lactamase domain protein [candidate division TM6 bacterium GW2011_GWE2_31_21]KKP54109.1 MAG: Beta-lactamase domain protein [candidate division TM6 bacterium GW2011_GWF2_33_332]HBS48309.1 hypothetical protein [Candidatus Dependentiae bacterium]HBZ73017.1 hypothetical protein [Candidatus Dependentiae bacterium]
MPLNLISITEGCYILVGSPRQPAPGLIVNADQKTAILIDSGPNDNVAKDIDKTVSGAGYQIIAIINTHHHADHCGGNHFFQCKYPNIKIYATEYEKTFIEHPFLEPMYLSSGAHTFSFVGNSPFLNAKPSQVTNVIPNEDGYILSEQGFQLTVRTLPGHTRGMIGIGTKNRVFYCADALFSRMVMSNHGLLFHTCIDEALKTLDKILNLTESYFSISMYHGGLATDVHELVSINKEKILEVSGFLLQTINNRANISIDDIVGVAVCRFENSEVEITPSQFLLNRTVIMAFLADMERAKIINIKIYEGKLVAQRN